MKIFYDLQEDESVTPIKLSNAIIENVMSISENSEIGLLELEEIYKHLQVFVECSKGYQK